MSIPRSMDKMGIPQDLKVRVEQSSLVFPSEETERRCMFLSNIDQVLNFDVQTVHFFTPHPDVTPRMAAEKLKSAFEKALVPYDFLAGRLRSDPSTGRLEIDCNRAGAGFVLASSQLSLNDLGDLVYPNPSFRQLIVPTLENNHAAGHPLCILQVTSFKCGGFAMGMSTNHVTFDGVSFKMFLRNLASLAGDKPMAMAPFNDRRVLAARSPPQVDFPHPELLKMPAGQGPSPPVFDFSQEDLDFRIFHLTSAELSSLKEMSKAGAPEGCSGRMFTSFNVVAAHIWRCKALSASSFSRSAASNNNDSSDNNNSNSNSKTNNNHDVGPEEEEKVSTVLYAVDIRPRLRPPLPSSYAGNAVLTAYASAGCRELEEGPLWRVVKMVWEGAERMSDEYARSAIDWGEVYKGFPHGEFLVSSWWRLGFAEVEYPWGRPKYSCPVVYHRKDIILFFPDMQSLPNASAGVNVLVALPPKEMHIFHTLFHSFLPHPN